MSEACLEGTKLGPPEPIRSLAAKASAIREDRSPPPSGAVRAGSVRHQKPLVSVRTPQPPPAAKRAKDAAGDKDVWVLGAQVARQLLRAGLLDEVRLHLAPLLMGEGTPLFAGERAELIPVGEPVAGAVTHLRYRVQR